MGMTDSELMRTARTVAQLRPGQAGQRLRLRAQRLALDHQLPMASRWLLSGPDPAVATGWPTGFAPLDAWLWRDQPGDAAPRAGALTLLGLTRPVAPVNDDGTPDWPAADWEAADAPLLWRFHLYYWDWAWALADQRPGPHARDTFVVMWRSWHAAVAPGRGPAWQPYPAALRAWSFCGIYRALAAGSPVEGSFLGELAAHAGFLRRSLETDVGGNHLIKNLKALAGLAVFFADDALLARVLRRLRRQLAVQVLPDGGHYERAPAYHCQVLGDLVDIACLLRAAGRAEPAGLPETIAAMRRWLGAVLTPAGDVPLLNDGFPVSPQLLTRLAPAPPPGGALHVLPDTGLARATVGSWHVLADIGPPCPRELPAHAHADTLSCLVYVDNDPLLIDTGTSTYAPGAARDRERSTAAHNTLEVDRRDSTEVWGAFRAGRRARVRGVSTRADTDSVTVEAAHDGYRSLPGQPTHRRRWSVCADELRVDDTVTGRGGHRIVVRWHLAPGSRLRLVSGGALVTTRNGQFTVVVTVTGTSAVSAATSTSTSTSTADEPTLTAAQAEVSTGFGSTAWAPVLACTLRPELPVRIRTVWRRAEPRQERT
jgi:uncharacterized heparinase superfamily protein